jgi:hypothetical protein
MARKNGITEIDVSGGFVDDRGRRVNTDIPPEERGRVSKGKSNARKRLKQREAKAKQAERERAEEDEQKKGVKKKKRKKKDDDPNSLDPSADKKRKKKLEAKSKNDLSKNNKPKAKGAESTEDKKKKKRKKKTVGELLEAGETERARKKMNKLNSKALTLIESEDHGTLMPPSAANSEAEFLNEYHHIYGTLGSIIRSLEVKMTEKDAQINSKDVYALMTMYSQMRETIADLRSIKDMNDQAEEIAQQVFDPATKSAGESLVTLYFKITTLVRHHVEDPAAVEAILERLKIDVGDQATNLQEQFGVARDRIAEVLNGGK